MKRTFWAPLLAVGAAILILVPTTFAVGEPGTTLFAQLGLSRFPNRSAAADARLQFLSESSIRLDVTIAGLPAHPWGVRIYSQGTCNNVLNWVANRDQSGQFISVLSNSGEHQIPLFSADVARIRAALAKGQTLSLMVAGTHPVTGLSYRTCTAFRAAPFPPLTTTSGTSTATSSATSTASTASTTSVSTTTPPVTIPVTTSPAATTTYSTATTVTGLLTVTTPVTVSTTTGSSIFFTFTGESVFQTTFVFTSTTTVFSTYTTGTTFTTVTTVTL